MKRSAVVISRARLMLLTHLQIFCGASRKISMQAAPIGDVKGLLNTSPSNMKPLITFRTCPKRSSKLVTRFLSLCISRPGQREVVSPERAILLMSTRFKMGRLCKCRPIETLKKHALLLGFGRYDEPVAIGRCKEDPIYPERHRGPAVRNACCSDFWTMMW